MAQILLLAKATGQSGRFEGNPVGVYADDHVFNVGVDKRRWLAEGNTSQSWKGTFYIVAVPTMPVTTAERIMQPWRRAATVIDPEFGAPDAEDRYVELGRHRWQLGVADKLPGPIKSKLRRDGFIELPYDVPTLNNYMIDRSGLDTFVPGVGGPIDP